MGVNYRYVEVYSLVVGKGKFINNTHWINHTQSMAGTNELISIAVIFLEYVQINYCE